MFVLWVIKVKIIMNICIFLIEKVIVVMVVVGLLEDINLVVI